VRLVQLAGAVAVPGEPDLMMSSHSPRGAAFCCAAEAMLIGLGGPDALRDLPLVGALHPKAIAALLGLAYEHGFLDRE
jgi:hypothetical protein